MIVKAMDTIKLKSDLHRLIERANDRSVLEAVKVILSKESDRSGDWADELSASLKEKLEDSIEEADEGKTIPHSEAMRQIKSRYRL